MTIRTMVVVAGLAALAGGCAVTTHDYEERHYQSGHGVYHEYDSYEGYYYVQIVYINGDPWYVDEYRRARPVPSHLHSHFRHSSWTRSLPPRFGRDDEVRDGYRVSRIVYINDVPHYVDDDRRARPVPSQLRSRFSYVTVMQGNERDRGGRPMQPAYEREQERRTPPAFVRERQEPPSYGRERGREEQPAYVRMRDREEPASYGREREREEPPAYRIENMPRPAVTQERMREERGRPAPPMVRNVGVEEKQSPGRGANGDEGRPLSQNRGWNGGNDERAGEDRGRGRVQPVSDDGQRRGAADGNESRADSASEGKGGKGRGRNGGDDGGDGEGGRRGRP